jgi:hypothetical protein
MRIPRIADFVVIIDPKFTIHDGIPRTFNFTLESGASLSSRSILMFDLFMAEGMVLTFNVHINGLRQMSRIFDSLNGFRSNSHHEVINVNVLRLGTNANTITFEITTGHGSIEFGDVVLFYQRNI